MGVKSVLVIKTKIQKSMKQCQNTVVLFGAKEQHVCNGNSNFYLGFPQVGKGNCHYYTFHFRTPLGLGLSLR